MNKRRNICTGSFRLGGYAGPVESGRGGQRKNADNFTGASPPVKKSGVFQLLKKFIATGLSIFMLGGTVLGVTNCDDSTGKSGPVGPDVINPENPDPKKPGPETLPKNLSSLNGIEDAGTFTTPSGEKVPGHGFGFALSLPSTNALIVKTMFFDGFKNQMDKTKQDFEKWSPATDKGSIFKADIVKFEDRLSKDWAGNGLNIGYVAGIRSSASPSGGKIDDHYQGLEQAILDLFGSDYDKKGKYSSALEALKLANYRNRRTEGTPPSYMSQSILNSYLSEINISSSDPEMLNKIEQYLIKNMPSEGGPHRFNPLLQIKNFYELKAYVDNVYLKGYSTDLSSVDKKTRTQIQTENGLFNSPELLSELA
ncbi:MAG: hypothetical protein LBH44_06395 [Treponema sp.]|jgi:hypothetical protein|nr:hypothetical protein [Treponema sp.]